jgi:pimeloyl-ACP methyl ester carboxylesterase
VPIATVNGVDLYFEVTGEGPPVVVIPGLGGDVRLFGGLITGLAPRCRVLAFDPRGAGRSGKPDTPYSMKMMAADAAALLDHLEMPSSHMLGTSMGGRIALALALEHPSAVRSLVLVSTSARTPPVRSLTWRWLVTEVIPRLPLPTRLDPQPRSAHLRQRAASRGFDCTDRLSEIAVPTLIAHGRRDRVVPYELALELSSGISGSRLITLRDGHFAFRADKERLTEAVIEFINASGAA